MTLTQIAVNSSLLEYDRSTHCLIRRHDNPSHMHGEGNRTLTQSAFGGCEISHREFESCDVRF
jgi:hypothetical protein